MQLIWQLLVSSLLLLFLSKFLPGFEIKDFKTSVIVSILYGIFMAASGFLAKFLVVIGEALVFLVKWIPIIGDLANLGMIITVFLLKFIVGAIILSFVDVIIKGFKMRNFGVAIVAAFIISVVNCFLPMF